MYAMGQAQRGALGYSGEQRAPVLKEFILWRVRFHNIIIQVNVKLASWQELQRRRGSQWQADVTWLESEEKLSLKMRCLRWQEKEEEELTRWREEGGGFPEERAMWAQALWAGGSMQGLLGFWSLPCKKWGAPAGFLSNGQVDQVCVLRRTPSYLTD